ncbi:diacylglycerol/lipid kinase family protein [Leadbettera azotonutricia]|uniref:Diacylglycerol kinase domain protein n=1 Tax=Leadbettera azotonutricia (strain ATCC BAA-888 / DSM 13862 / ZAS-9) TaxID=545695 RepID=F5Y6X9_LEAAZ|nr:diacylglycerol kinase family protein [Leadbettera azotonutricia]AEF82185.1 diacylglycerol kinase domain protein [Leadbettera azotonutricia ZAS-9]
MAKKHLFIINPKSFPKKRKLQQVIAAIDAYFTGRKAGNLPREDFFIHIEEFPRDSIIVIRKYMQNLEKETALRVYSIGGDGTSFCCLNGIMGLPNTDLAIMPHGTGNDFVRNFGEEHIAEFRDITLQTGAKGIPTDIIHCGDNYALSYCTIGMESAVIIGIQPWNKQFEKIRRRFNWINSAFIILGAIQVAFNKAVINQYYTINADGEDLSGSYALLNIANGPCYGIDKNAVITAVPDDGFLDMLLLKSISPLRILLMMGPYLKGEFAKYPKYFIWRRIKKVSINSESPLFVNMDGEAFFDSELTCEVVPGAVNIAAPNGLSYQRRAAPHE